MEKFNRYLKYIDHEIYINDQRARDLIDKYQTPLYVYSTKIFKYNIQNYVKALDSSYKDYLVCFALKSNNNLDLLKILSVQQNVGADVVSSNELLRALEANIHHKKIVFSGVGKTEKDIRLGIEKDILSFNVESIDELKLINKVASENEKTVNIAFRLNPQVVAKTHKHISTGHESHKFGLLKDDILEAISNKSYWSNLRLIGLSMHIGSQLTQLDETKTAARELCLLAKEIDSPLQFLDFGGGLGVKYQDINQVPPIEEYVNEITKIVKEFNIKPKIILEPGRSISAECGFLLTKVIRNKVSAQRRFMIVDAGMNDFARPSLYGAYHHIYPSREGEVVETDVFGPICESADCFGKERMLPKLTEDDFLVICDVGAYGRTMSSQYNMRELPKEIIID